MTQPEQSRTRVAVIGCGAVTEGFHLPVLAGHPAVVLTALIDPDVARARRLAALYDIPTVFESADRVDSSVADAALVATPPFLHAQGTIDLVGRGLHVLVEKPLALSHADGVRMVAAAREHHRVLSVSLFRRLLPAVRLFRAALDSGEIGDPIEADAEVGDAYTWQLKTLSGMRKEQAGGGILVDMGSHVLDLLLYICNADPTLVEYGDNALEGVETDCVADLRLRTAKGSIRGRVELSRTRTLRNTIRVRGSAGVIEWKFGERFDLSITRDRAFIDSVSGVARPYDVRVRWADEPDRGGLEGFRAQVDDWLAAIGRTRDAALSAASALPTVKLIEDCYASRAPLAEPWFTEGLPGVSTHTSRKPASSRRVLITGASGFIGCRLSERLHYDSDWHVRALIRSPGRAVRLARMPINLAVGDLTSTDSLARALDGCDAVVHGGIGTSWRSSERVAVNVKGTKTLVDAALKAGVKRFVHLSTIALYGDRDGTIAEDTPLDIRKGWDYAESKLQAEDIVREAAARGLRSVILRIAVVYGPHNMTVVTKPLQHLLRNQLALAACDDVPSNTIYVDNLCHGIRLALDGPADLDGQTFLLSDDDGFTWGEYFGYFANRVGVPLRRVPKPMAVHGETRKPSVAGRWYANTKDLVTSSEVKALAKRVYGSDPWGAPARWFVETFPLATDRLKQLIRPETGFIYEPAAPSPGDHLMTINPLPARVSTEKARRVLGFEPIVSRERAMDLTLAWARYARILPDLVREDVRVDV